MAREDRGYPYSPDRYGARRDEVGPRGGGFGRSDYPDDERGFGQRDYGRFAGEDDYGRRSDAGYGRGPIGQDYADRDPYLDDWRRRGSFAGGYAGGHGHSGHQNERGMLARAGDEVASWFGSDDAERRRRHDAEAGDVSAQHHRGKGPRGYVRSDDRIREDIHDHLTDDPHLDASEIEVTVSNREVTLNGMVNSRTDKRRAEDIAEDVSGVTHVQNNLRVQAQSATGERASVL